jgi:hypothetical protein
MTAVAKLQRWWVSARTRWQPYVGIAWASDDLPRRLQPRRVYLTGNPTWRVAFLCPCGCGSVVELCVLAEVDPHWRFAVDDKRRVSLQPSVWRTNGCRSHYFIRRGRIMWA